MTHAKRQAYVCRNARLEGKNGCAAAAKQRSGESEVAGLLQYVSRAATFSETRQPRSSRIYTA